MAVRYERVTVTPVQAKKWLGMNAEHNRAPRDRKIQAYARDMLSGNWNSDSGETIKFDQKDTLIDGQNRLRAVVAAGIPVEFDVAYGLPSAAMLVIDSGISRTGADALRISGARSVARAAAIVRWSIFWDAGAFMGNATFKMAAPTNSEIFSRYEADAGLFDSAAARATDCQNRGLGQGAPVGTAHYLFSRIDLEDTHRFFDQYISGANLSNAAPALTLRNRMAKVRMERITRSEQLALFVRAWNAFRANEPLARVIVSNKGDLSNANFPQPK